MQRALVTLAVLSLLVLAACGGSGGTLDAPQPKATQMVHFPPPANGPSSNMVYLVDNPAGGGDANLYKVRFNDAGMYANLEQATTFAGFSSAHIATTWDGDFVYAVNSANAKMGVYDVNADTFTVLTDGGSDIQIKDNGSVVGGIVLATFRPDGILYVASGNTDKIYKVDTMTGEATSLGHIYPYGYWPEDNGPYVDMEGADLSFDAVGNLYLYTNANNGDVSKGLYWVDYEPMHTSVVQASQLDWAANGHITGVSLNFEGTGDLVFSNDTHDVLSVVNRGDFSFSDYTMMLDGQPFNHHFGDMSIAFGTWLGNEPPEYPEPEATNCAYLTSNGLSVNFSGLYKLDFDHDNMYANMEMILDLSEWDFSTTHIGTTFDGESIFMVDEDTNRALVYDIDSGTASLITDGGGNVLYINENGNMLPKVVQVAFHPDGTLYIGDHNTDEMYILDPVTLSATSLGKVYAADSGASLGIAGADISFDADGNLLFYTNQSKSGAPAGLYSVDYSGSPLSATHLGFSAPDGVTGAAHTFQGTGDGLLLSHYSEDVVKWLNLDDETFSDFDLMWDGEPFNLGYGDMAIGFDCAGGCEYEAWQRPLLVRNCEDYDVGWVYGVPDCENGRLNITFEVGDGWMLDQTYVYVSNTPPTGLLPEHMFYHVDLNGAAIDMFSIDIMNEIPGFECGDTLYIATEAIVYQMVGDCEEMKWASSVLDNWQGTTLTGAPISADRSDPNAALGAPDGPGIGSFYSLGLDLTNNVNEGGWVELGFDYPIYNGPGVEDVTTLEITWGRYSDDEELAAVYVIDRNGNEHFCGIASNYDGNGTRTGISKLAIPEYVNFADYVRLIDVSDVSSQSSNMDDGYDIDAVGVNCLARYKAAWSWHSNWNLWFAMPCVPTDCDDCGGDDDDPDDPGDPDDPDEPGYECAMTTNLLAGQYMLAGDVFAGIDEDGILTVSITNSGPWTMTETHLYVGLVPPTNHAPGQFPYSHENLGNLTVDTYTIDMFADFPGFVLGDPIHIATHAVTHNGQGGSETAWGEGTPFGGGWAMYFTLDCPED